MTRFLALVLGGWFVVTYAGKAVAGPFIYLADCAQIAQALHEQYANVSDVCRYIM